ncbi:ExbD/TolR family protein [Planctomicrobium sp. SH527]|uniref:ExbD/TolR family protein n=1 Tax=Planctomicrobium sp. SH527 TaxID=3448123 RepID=UPI003F5BE4E0
MFSSKRHRDPPEEDDEINITAMIDIVMLLLIFFMITSKLQESSTLQVPAAKHGKEIAVDQSLVINVYQTDDSPEIYLSSGRQENGPVDYDSLRSFIRTGINEGRTNVIIKADRNIPSGFVEEVSKVIAEVDPDLKFYLGVIDRPD